MIRGTCTEVVMEWRRYDDIHVHDLRICIIHVYEGDQSIPPRLHLYLKERRAVSLSGDRETHDMMK